ncbi:TPA: KR domain-containing protein [Corynebacterium striatum]|nr:KR domain-containing protein [Corynebacterium striatum]
MSYTWLASHEAASSIQTDASQFDGVAHACQCALTDTDQTQQLADLLSQRAPLHGIIHCATVMSKNLMGIDCQMRVLGTGVPETRYCRVPGSWYRGRADGVGPAVCFIRPVLLGRWPCACRSLRYGFGGRC